MLSLTFFPTPRSTTLSWARSITAGKAVCALCICALAASLSACSDNLASAHLSSTPKVLRVPEDHRTLADALAAATSGDTILISPGIHRAGVSLEGKGVILASLALTTGDTSYVRRTILDGRDDDYVLYIPTTTARAVIYGLTLRNAEDCIYPNAHFELHRSVITGCNDGIDYEQGSGGLLRESVIENNGDDGIDLDGDPEVVIENNVIRYNSDDGIEVRLDPIRVRSAAS